MADLRAYLYKLHSNLNILCEREAKYGGNAPLELLNQIEDHKKAILLTQQVLNSELSEIEWREALKPLLLSLNLFGDFLGPRAPLRHPPRAEHFIDREAELNQLLADLQPGKTITLCGPGGIGKSALAVEAIWVLAPGDTPPNLFPDGIIFHSFSGQPQVDLALESIAWAFGHKPEPTPRDAAQRALAGRQALLVLDGTEDADNLPILLGITGKCGVLITSRTSEDAPGDWQDIAPLPLDEAVKLLQAWANNWAKDRDTARRICELVGRLPLAVRLIGRYLSRRKQHANIYLKWLESSPLQALDQGKREAESVPLLLERSLVQVSDEAKSILAVVGLLALAPFDGTVLADALDVSIHRAEYLLGELVSYGLLLRPQDRYEVSHALIHTYAQRHLKVLTEVVERLVIYYTDFVKEQSELGLAGYIRLDIERVHIMAILGKCVEQADWKAVLSLISAMDSYLSLRDRKIERITVAEAGLVAARAINNRRAEGHFLGELGLADYHNRERAEQIVEYFEQALAIARETDDRHNEGRWLGYLGFVFHTFRQQPTDKSIEYLEQALTIARETNDRHSEVEYLGQLGIVQRDTGDVAQAIVSFDKAITVAREINDQHSEGNLLGSLGLACCDLGKTEQGTKYLEQALIIALETGNKTMEYVWLNNLKKIYQYLGQLEKALKYYELALATARKFGDRYSEADDLYSIGKLYKALGDISLAKEYLQQSLYIHEEINSPHIEGTRKLLSEVEANISTN